MAAECPVSLNHTRGPEGYVAWHEWAAEMSKTHRQKRCRSCRLWVIWEPTRADETGPSATREVRGRETRVVGPERTAQE